MKFDEKIDKAERLFKYSKATKFLKPQYGFYALIVSIGFLIAGNSEVSSFISLTVIAVSSIGIISVNVSHKLFLKGLSLVTEADTEERIDHDELLRRIGRQLKALDNAI